MVYLKSPLNLQTVGRCTLATRAEVELVGSVLYKRAGGRMRKQQEVPQERHVTRAIERMLHDVTDESDSDVSDVSVEGRCLCLDPLLKIYRHA